MTVDRPPNTFAVQLRRNQTDVEQALWHALRNRQLSGTKFRRQVPIGPYIGGQHSVDIDRARQTWLEQQGYKVLRFWNHEVTGNLAGVLETIARSMA